jgi:hypothetical protein
MTARIPIVSLLGFLLSTAAVGAASQGPACGSYALTGGEKVINVVDNPPEGPSPGDARAGSRQLVDDTGAEVGTVYFVATQTATATADRGSVLASQYFVWFENGTISSSSVYQLADAADTSQRAGNAVLVVSGGTGAFENAKGRIVIKAGDPPTYEFNLSCA